MSQRLISRSPDLQRLRDDGYDIEIRSGYLLVKSVPYVNSRKEVALGVLVSVLTLAGDVTTTPSDHVVMFAGEYPCRADGTEIASLRNSSAREVLGPGFAIDHRFSNKPTTGSYRDYFEKMTSYVNIIAGPAEAIDPTATARVNRFVESVNEESVFAYLDTASSNAGIAAISQKLVLDRVGVVGLGGTGSYVLDMIAKTPIREIHLFDGEPFLQHNAFRSPGAASGDALRSVPRKVEYFARLYSNIHRHIVSHDCFVDESNVEDLRGMAFVFLCLDRGRAKKVIVERLLEWGVRFVDVGMGVELSDGTLSGVLRVTAVTTTKRDHVPKRIPFSDADANDAYSRNIQIADLNALNAALAVIKWKKMCGFYRDLEHEHFSAYALDGNALINEESS